VCVCPPGVFYPNPPAFDASASYIPPPPYSAPLGQQPPHDPDLPSSAAGEALTELLLGRDGSSSLEVFMNGSANEGTALSGCGGPALGIDYLDLSFSSEFYVEYQWNTLSCIALGLQLTIILIID